MAAEVTRRMAHVMRVFAGYGFRWMLDRVGLGGFIDHLRHRGKAAPDERGAVNFRLALERLGPFWIKIGQMLATRPDMVPDAYIQELEKLQEQVSVQPFADMEEVIRRNVPGEISNYFSRIDREPLGAASLAQVYSAALQNGEEVVIKVRRPGAKEMIQLDMRVFERIAGIIAKRAPDFSELVDLGAMLETIFASMRAETDFAVEAENMEDFSEMIEDDEDFDRIFIPRVYSEYSTEEILTMERIRGQSVRFLSQDPVSEEERLEMATQLARFMYKQYLIEGYFHADPHPGNVFYTEDNRLAIIDWGMVGKVDVRMMEYMIRIMLNSYLNDGLGVAIAWMEMGNPTKRANKPKFISDCQRFIPTMAGADFDKLNFGVALSQIMGFALKNKISTSPAVAMLGKSFANMDGAVRCITGAIAPIDVFIDYFPKIALYHTKRVTSKESVGRFMMDFVMGSSRFPEQGRLILDQIVNDRMKFLLEPTGYDLFLKKLEKALFPGYRFLGICILLAAFVMAYAIFITFSR